MILAATLLGLKDLLDLTCQQVVYNTLVNCIAVAPDSLCAIGRWLYQGLQDPTGNSSPVSNCMCVCTDWQDLTIEPNFCRFNIKNDFTPEEEEQVWGGRGSSIGKCVVRRRKMVQRTATCSNWTATCSSWTVTCSSCQIRFVNRVSEHRWQVCHLFCCMHTFSVSDSEWVASGFDHPHYQMYL